MDFASWSLYPMAVRWRHRQELNIYEDNSSEALKAGANAEMLFTRIVSTSLLSLP